MKANNSGKIIKAVLRKELGKTWFIFLIRSSFYGKSLFKKSQWGKSNSEESKFLKRFSIVVALYLKLTEEFGKDKAYQIMYDISVPVGLSNQMNLVQSAGISDEFPMKRLMAFIKLMESEGATKYNEKIYVTRSAEVCHLKMKRCVFNDFFDAFNVPELTKLFCEVDFNFFPKGFPKLNAHRNGSWENTLAYGKKECDFVWELKRESSK